MKMTDFDLYMKSPQEMAESFEHITQAIDNTQKVAELCNFELRLGEIQLPQYEVPGGYTAESYLRHLAEEGLKKRFGGSTSKEHIERMNFELAIIEKTGFANYMLVVSDYTNFAKSEGISTNTRGSAAGSKV